MHLQYIPPITIDAIVAQDSKAYMYAVARATASVLPIPPSPVLNAQVYFNEYHLEMSQKIVACFNEAKPLSIDTAVSLAKMFWLIRYSTVHDAADDSLVEGLVVKPCLMDLFGATAFMSNEQRDYLLENHTKVLTTVGMCIKAARKMHTAFLEA